MSQEELTAVRTAIAVEMTTEITAVRAAMSAEMSAVRSEMERRVDQLHSQLHYWQNFTVNILKDHYSSLDTRGMY